MKIILVNYRYYVTGGPEIYMFKVKKLLEDAGHEVIPFSVKSERNIPSEYSDYFAQGKSQTGDAYYGQIKKSPKNIARLLSGAFYNRDAYKNLRRLIRDTRPDVVYVLQQVNALSPSVFRAAKDEGVRIVHRLSDFNMMCARSDFLLDGNICTSCLRGDYSAASANRCVHGSRTATTIRVAAMRLHRRMRMFDDINTFICPSRFTAELLKQSGIGEEKITSIPTFVNSEKTTSKRSNVKHSNAKRSNDDYALYLGRIAPEKGIDYLIAAAEANPRIHMFLTGSTNSAYAQTVLQKVEKAGLSDRIQFTGFVEGAQKDEFIDNAACILCPSIWYENMPNVVLEAYAHGKPVIAFNVGCMSEFVEDGVTGCLVTLKDAISLGQAIETLLNEPGIAANMGKSAREKCVCEYSPDAHLRALLEVFGASSSSPEKAS
jgi:glycosyltransferase involved in cell wall biosynthesis